jgi:hypothetical protein
MGGSAVVENRSRPVPQEDLDDGMVDVSLEAASPRPGVTAAPKSEIRSRAVAKGTKEIDYNMLWYIHGQAYDLTDWLDKHPGEYCDTYSMHRFDSSFFSWLWPLWRHEIVSWLSRASC